MPEPAHRRPLLEWYAGHARDLPWRRPGTDPWAVLVSEVMLQQTPVARVLPVWTAWMRRWPTPAALARASPGEALRAWGRLGYPRRAVRLHAAAGTIRSDHDGRVPGDLAALRALPGVGDYTAAAVACFGFGQRHVVLDTNVRRVLARAFAGSPRPARTVTGDERRLAARLLPVDGTAASRWNVALMELGALVCRARSPECAACPVATYCRWRTAGFPAGPGGRTQRYAGTDRQCRGRLLAALTAADDPVPRAALIAAWQPAEQRERALASLVADGLVQPLAGDTFGLPGA